MSCHKPVTDSVCISELRTCQEVKKVGRSWYMWSNHTCKAKNTSMGRNGEREDVETFAFWTLPGTAVAVDVRFNNTLATFDCYSYAGPVPDVTWWKNGVVISLNETYQQSKVLLNATFGIYRITLNVTAEPAEIVGIYSCSVNNSRGRYHLSPRYTVLGETCDLLWLKLLLIQTPTAMNNVVFSQWVRAFLFAHTEINSSELTFHCTGTHCTVFIFVYEVLIYVQCNEKLAIFFCACGKVLATSWTFLALAVGHRSGWASKELRDLDVHDPICCPDVVVIAYTYALMHLRLWPMEYSHCDPSLIYLHSGQQFIHCNESCYCPISLS